MEQIDVSVKSSDQGAVLSPMFRALMQVGIARNFEGSVTNRMRKQAYRANHVLVDQRQNSVWSEHFLSDELNIDGIAERLVDDETRGAVLDWLTEGSNYTRVMETIYPPFVKFNDRSTTAPLTVGAVAETGLKNEAGQVVADMLVHVLKPTGTIEPTDAWYTSKVYLGPFPKYAQLMTELLKHELVTSLVGLPKSLTENVSGKIGREILAQRVMRQFEDVIIKLKGIGEYSLALQDVLLLVRAKAYPDRFMPSIIDGNGGKNAFDRDWLNHESIARLASNLTVLQIAMENTEHTYIRTMPHRMDTWIARVSSFLTGGGRYREITVADFKARYSKQAVEDNFGVRQYAVLSQNVDPGAHAQVVDFIAGNKKTSSAPVKMYEVGDASSEMAGLFGRLPERLTSEHISNLTVSGLSEDATLERETESGIVHFAMDRYALGKRRSKVATEYDRDAVELALACASFETVFIVESGENSNVFSFMFEMPSPRTAYMPKSGVRDLDTLYLADPAEALMMVEDWFGTYKESTHVQTIPKQALRMPYVNLEPILFIDMSRDIQATIGYSGSIGGSRKVNTNLLKLMGRPQSSTHQAVAPLMVNAQGNNYYAVLHAIQDAANQSENEMIKQSSKAAMITEITALAEAMAGGTMESYAVALRRQIATESPLAEQGRILATMESKLYRTQINIVLAALITRRLGVFAAPEEKDDLMLSILSSSAFFLRYELPV